MDGVLCDFYGAARKALKENPKQPFPQAQWGFFLKLKPIDGALEAFNYLFENYDVWILTRPSTRNVNCYTEKAQWVWDHLGEKAVDKLILSCDKNLLKGDYLIDDNHWDFEGEHIHFNTEKFPNWETVVKYIDSSCKQQLN
jgi:5'(3')-deoxyribonucleotidase